MKALLLPVQLALIEEFNLTELTAENPLSERPKLDRIGYYSALLDFLAQETPALAPFFKRARFQIQQHARRTATGDFQAVIKAMANGASKVSEIAAESHLPENQAYKILRQLHRTGFVSRTSALKDPGRGGDIHKQPTRGDYFRPTSRLIVANTKTSSETVATRKNTSIRCQKQRVEFRQGHLINNKLV